MRTFVGLKVVEKMEEETCRDVSVSRQSNDDRKVTSEVSTGYLHQVQYPRPGDGHVDVEQLMLR